jgi:hypothetical protein
MKSLIRSIPAAQRLNAAIKAPLQERKARSQQRYYEQAAIREGIALPTAEHLESLLRQRISARRAGRRPAKMSQMHIFLAYYVSNWEAVLPYALAPFGRVSAFEWRAAGYDDRKTDWLDRRDEMNRAMLDAFNTANAAQPVDAVVAYVSGHNTSPQTLEAMGTAGAAVFNFCWDDKLNFPGQMLGGRWTSPAAIAHAVDLNLTNAPASVIKYMVHGGLAMFWPLAAHPQVHRPHDIPFEFDVSFVGGCYGWRPRFIKCLEAMGIRVACFGSGWPSGPLSDEELVRLYSRSRINLGFGGVAHSRRLLCVKGRDFEVPMSGGLYLTQHNAELERVFEIGREIVTYTDEADCAAKIRWLLNHPAEADLIRKAGLARSLREHTYEARWREVFCMAGLLESERRRHNSPDSNS